MGSPALRPALALLLTAGASIAGCSGGVTRAAVAPTARGRAGAWSYEATLAEGARTIDVLATFAPGTAGELTVTEGAEPFVRDVAVAEADDFRAVAPHGTSWMIPSCARGCVVRYRFELDLAARALGTDSTARGLGEGAYEATPSTWLLHPLELPKEATFRLRMHVTTPDAFATGLRRGAAGAYEAPVESLPFAPYSVFGRVRSREIDLPASAHGAGAELRLAVAPGPMRTSDKELERWILRAAGAVRDYYGAFPIDDALVVVIPRGHREVGYGRTMAGGGASIMIDVGPRSEARDLDDDWVAVHEMLHLAFPSIPHECIWMEEGLATYLEPLVRARAGMLEPREVWLEFARMMHNGLPEPGDLGLDRTHTWGRVYWGGALFCLVADVEIRRATHGARSLDDAVRGILAEGGNDAARWDMARACAVGDAATGTRVLSDLYARMGRAPGTIDLDALFGELGVHMVGVEVVLDDAAKLAAQRREMTGDRGR